jgi:predicted O-methyltransferase YrrM
MRLIESLLVRLRHRWLQYLDMTLAASRGRERADLRYAPFVHALAALFGERAENEVHPHVPAERAELYHSIDGGSTELEVLNMLHALVYLFKPQRILETGTWHGFGAIAMAAGLRLNRRGLLLTIDHDPGALRLAKRHIRVFDASLFDFIRFESGDSIEFLMRYEGDPFDFTFLDSSITDRIHELEVLQTRHLLTPDALCLVHDTSRHRQASVPEDTRRHAGLEYLNNLEGLDVLDELRARHEGFEFPYSRGFQFVKFTAPGTSGTAERRG